MPLKKNARLYPFVFWAIAACLTAILAAGCQGLHSPALDPETFVVRNLTDHHVSSFTLKASTSDQNRPRRFGTIAPVPRGASQVYIRPHSAPSLPEQVVAEWVMGNGAVLSKVVVFSELDMVDWEPDAGVLYFDLLPRGELMVSLQKAIP